MQEAIGSKSHQCRKECTEMVKGIPEGLGGALQCLHIINVYGAFASARKLSFHVVYHLVLKYPYELSLFYIPRD